MKTSTHVPFTHEIDRRPLPANTGFDWTPVLFTLAVAWFESVGCVVIIVLKQLFPA